MNNRNSKILIADDEGYIIKLLQRLLGEEGYELEFARNGSDALEKIMSNTFAVILVDLTLPEIDGLEILSIIKEQSILTETIIFTGKGSVPTAVEDIKKGAYDYLEKPVEPYRLRTLISKALEHNRLVISQKRLEQEIKNLTRYEDLIGQSNEMLEIYKLIDAVGRLCLRNCISHLMHVIVFINTNIIKNVNSVK